MSRAAASASCWRARTAIPSASGAASATGWRTSAPGRSPDREDLELVVAGIRDLMAMPSAGDLVLYGLEAAPGHVSFIAETGAHAGPTADEMQTFIITPPACRCRADHASVQLYPHFVRYQDARRDPARRRQLQHPPRRRPRPPRDLDRIARVIREMAPTSSACRRSCARTAWPTPTRRPTWRRARHDVVMGETRPFGTAPTATPCSRACRC
jgi:hypothetical protein